MCKIIGKSNERILYKLNKSEILRLYSIVHVAMETTKTSNFTCQSKSFISIFSTCQVSACELQPFSCHDLANDIHSQTAKTVFSHLKTAEMKLLSGIPHANYWHIIGAHTPTLSLLSIYAQFWDYSFLICKAKIKFRDAKKTEKASVTGTLGEPRNFFLYATTRIDPFTVFSTIDLDKLGNLSTPQERAP